MRMISNARLRDPVQSTVSFSHMWGTKHNHSIKEYNSVSCAAYHLSSVSIPSGSLLAGPHGPEQCVLKLLPPTFILSINMTVNDHLMEILVQFRKCHPSLFALGV